MAERSFDLVLANVVMPVKDGFEVMKELRRSHPDVKFFAIVDGNLLSQENYIKIAWAVLRRRKFFTFINLFGISFTLAMLMVAVECWTMCSVPHIRKRRLIAF